MKDTRRLELKDALNLTVMMFEELEHLEEDHEVVGPESFGQQPNLQVMDTVTSSEF